MFNVGDRVKLTKNLTLLGNDILQPKGTEGVVFEIFEGGTYEIKFDKGYKEKEEIWFADKDMLKLVNEKKELELSDKEVDCLLSALKDRHNILDKEIMLLRKPKYLNDNVREERNAIASEMQTLKEIYGRLIQLSIE